MKGNLMNPNSPRDALTRSRCANANLAALFLLLLVLGPLAPHPAGAHHLLDGEPFLYVMVHPSAPDFLAVSGAEFSPGGPVLISIAAPSDSDIHHETWTFASSFDSWGAFGAGAANLEFIPAGRIRAMIPLNGEPQYGPHGSQDPARGYAPADDIAALRLALCHQGLDVQAFDARTGTWSHNIHMVAMC